MNQTFFTNTIWYLLLDCIAVVIISITFSKKKNVKLIPFFLFLIGIAYLFELFVLTLFNAYAYNPELLNNEYYDNIFGANSSQGFIVPAVALLISAFNLNFIWIFAWITFFWAIEELFLTLGIYEHFWWRGVYTVVGLLVYFVISRIMVRWLQVPMQGIRLMIVLFFGIIVTLTTSDYITTAFLQLYQYDIGWFENPGKDHVVFSTMLIYLYAALICTSVVRQWSGLIRGIILAVIILNAYLLLRLDILHLMSAWYFPVYFISLTGTFILFSWFYRKLALNHGH